MTAAAKRGQKDNAATPGAVQAGQGSRQDQARPAQAVNLILVTVLLLRLACAQEPAHVGFPPVVAAFLREV